MTALKVIVAAVTTAMVFMVAAALAVVSVIATHLVAVSIVALLVAGVVAYGRRRSAPVRPPQAPAAPRPTYPTMTYPVAQHGGWAAHARSLPPRPAR